MKTSLCLLLALTTLSAPALDLTPSYANTAADGITIRRPYFADGSKKYAVTLNVETDLQPYEDGCLFRFLKLKQAAMRLRLSSFSVAQKFNADTLDQYQQAARKLLPQGAEGVTLEMQIPNPMPVNGWQGHRFTYKYTLPAGEVRESITFLNITPTQQVIVQVYALEKDFADASERGWDILRRWHELDSSTVLRGS